MLAATCTAVFFAEYSNLGILVGAALIFTAAVATALLSGTTNARP